MLLQMRPCSRCGLNTYHKFVNSLRCRLTSRCHWKCMECGQEQPGEAFDPAGLKRVGPRRGRVGRQPRLIMGLRR